MAGAGAHTLIPENKVIPDYALVMGTPGKVVKELTPEQVPPDLFTLFKCSRWAKACAGWVKQAAIDRSLGS